MTDAKYHSSFWLSVTFKLYLNVDCHQQFNFSVGFTAAKSIMILEHSKYRLNCIAMAACHLNNMKACIFRALAIACFCAWIGNIGKIYTLNDKSRNEKVSLNGFLYWWKMKLLSLSALLLHLFPGKKEFGASNKYANYNLGHSFKIFK